MSRDRSLLSAYLVGDSQHEPRGRTLLIIAMILPRIPEFVQGDWDCLFLGVSD